MHEAFVRYLRQLPWDDRGYDPETHHWWVAQRWQEMLCQAACASYDEVYLIDGNRTLNIGTGQVTQQGSLFEEG